MVPAWNEAEFTGPSITAIQVAMNGIEQRAQLIVVDNNSIDATASIAAAGAEVVFAAVNQIARARNAGANAANAATLVFVDADSQISKALLQQALEAVAMGNAVGGGAVIAPDRAVGRLTRTTRTTRAACPVAVRIHVGVANKTPFEPAYPFRLAPHARR